MSINHEKLDSSTGRAEIQIQWRGDKFFFALMIDRFGYGVDGDDARGVRLIGSLRAPPRQKDSRLLVKEERKKELLGFEEQHLEQ